MEVDGQKLIPGKFYLWKVATQEGTKIDLNSVYFVTDNHTEENPDIYEVVFTRPAQGTQANSWYLVKKEVIKKIEEKEIPEAEIVETPNDTLQIQVEDELKLGELLNGG